MRHNKKPQETDYQEAEVYTPRTFRLHGLKGISAKTLETHFKLYEGYVQATNQLTDKIYGLYRNGRIDSENFSTFSELKRHLGFEYNGMVLHEYYFENLTSSGGELPSQGNFFRKVTADFGNFNNWKNDFVAVGQMRGVGWAICFLDPKSGHLTNLWINQHEMGNVAGFQPILVLDVWEHAYLLDYPPSERNKYIEAFFSNIDWQAVEKRLKE